MPSTRTKAYLFHSSDNADGIRSAGGLRGTDRDANAACRDLRLTKIWACAESSSAICCGRRGGTRFQITASDLRRVCTLWRPYRPRDMNAYRRRAGPNSNHVFYNIILVPKKKKLSQRQKDRLVRADLEDGDPIQFYWNGGDMYWVDRRRSVGNDDSSDSSSSSSSDSGSDDDSDENRHVHVAICTNFLKIQSAVSDDSTSSDSDDSDSTDVQMGGGAGGDSTSCSDDSSMSDDSSAGNGDSSTDGSDSSGMHDCLLLDGHEDLHGSTSWGDKDQKKKVGDPNRTKRKIFVPFLLDGSARAGGFELEKLVAQTRKGRDREEITVTDDSDSDATSIVAPPARPCIEAARSHLPPLKEIAARLPDSEKSNANGNVLNSVGTSLGAIKFDTAGTKAEKRTQFASAMRLAFAHADFGGELTYDGLCAWHQTLMGPTCEHAGKPRGTGQGVHCGARQFSPGGAQVEEGLSVFARAVNELVEDLHAANEDALGTSRDIFDDQERVMRVAAFAVVHLTMLHPFRDGNGRLGRLLVLYVLRRCGLANVLPTLCEAGEKRGTYVEALREAQTGREGNITNVADWIEKCCYASVFAATNDDAGEGRKHTFEAAMVEAV